MLEFDPGPVVDPFRTLAAQYPDATAYPFATFRVEWGPIFHRGRLDGSARVLAIGQDPAHHENVLRRILVGKAGRRAQGFLQKIGITRSYVMINALLYSVYGSGGAKFVDDPLVSEYRNKWIDAITGPGKVEAVVTFGGMAKKAWEVWKATPTGAASTLPIHHVAHPTYPESASRVKAEQAKLTKELLRGWSAALQALRPAIQHADQPIPSGLYGPEFTDADLANIPSFDLPAGIPPWMYDVDGWATRAGATAAEKRVTIKITVPKGVIPS